MAYAIRKTQYDPMTAAHQAEPEVNRTIFNLIDQFDYVEKMCEEALARQEEIARQYYTVPGSAPAVDDMVEVKSGDMRSRSEMSISDIAFKDFKQLHRLAQTVVPGGLPKASRRFVINACTPSFVEIEDLEEMIKLYRYRMSVIEQDILDKVPASAGEAVAKLQFMSSLMLDGGSIEVDFFAYLVEECAEVIATKLPRRNVQ